MMHEIQSIAHNVYGTNVLTCDPVTVAWVLGRYATRHGLTQACQAQRTVNAIRSERGRMGFYDIITPIEETP